MKQPKPNSIKFKINDWKKTLAATDRHALYFFYDSLYFMDTMRKGIKNYRARQSPFNSITLIEELKGRKAHERYPVLQGI
jgi:hypothetical protein